MRKTTDLTPTLLYGLSEDGASRVARTPSPTLEGNSMNSIVYIVGAVVIIVALLSFLGLR
ncbi:MAG: hypothetical protein ACKVQQ_11715 [Burkholderiales bacterium]